MYLLALRDLTIHYSRRARVWGADELRILKTRDLSFGSFYRVFPYPSSQIFGVTQIENSPIAVVIAAITPSLAQSQMEKTGLKRSEGNPSKRQFGPMRKTNATFAFKFTNH